MNNLTPDPAHDVTGNGTESHYALAQQLEMRGYTVEADSEDNEHSEVFFQGEHVGDIRGDSEATVTSLCDEDSKECTSISISVNGIWAGSGKLRDGIIEDCGAVFAGDQDESENVYELIEEAIQEGKDSLNVELSDNDDAVVISWTIVDQS